MHILFLGYSSLVRRRILPMLDQLPQITRVSIAKAGSHAWDESAMSVVHERFVGYEAAERQCRPDLVYVSTVNSAHHALAKTWLQKGCHVVIDKPATLSLADTQSLLAVAADRNVLVAEATVYTFHPQVALIRDAFRAAGSAPRYMTAQFSFPALEATNFRYRADLGGGALFDTAPYAVSLGRVFFADLPTTVFGTCNERTADGLCISYSVLLQYPGGRSLIGHFGFTTQYSNHLSLFGDSVAVDVDRIFTTPETGENSITVRCQNSTTVTVCPPANSFVLFFEHLFSSLEQGAYGKFADDMRYDAQVTQSLRQQIEGALD